ncbi:unnamed protein product [Rotaria socialis]|uniref:Uncharacterized protein n=2 Tax=Rotaria socialis TaxID=392032 RepID=A0A818LKB8_9BILA|nr:unnamed protein product [Rotaria socialis]CAF3574004.1 unnamed protein product [Rotaria socialis]CAF4423882.1 unnamed protein product [Rotaria socialis]CAF4860908.1 unnamed protein product [Rotaria socialis]
MGLHPRDCLTHYHLIGLTGVVAVSLILVIVGGSLAAWCIRYGETFECHSLLHSERAYSCLFKLMPTGVIFSLIISLFMFIILIIGRVYAEYTGIAKKEYQLVARLVNIFALSLAIVLVMIVLLQWYHPSTNSSAKILIAMVPISEPANNSTKPKKEENIVFQLISSDHPLYLKAVAAKRRSITSYHENLNHGPNIFFAAAILLFITLLIFVLAHRV